jgi:hypothetical protein
VETEIRLEDAMRNRLVTALALAVLVVPAALAQQHSQPQSARLGNGAAGTAMASKKPVAQAFTHPTLGFRVVAPPGAKITEKADGRQVSIRSHRGYAVNMQSGLTRADIPLQRMSSLLETKYLGDGKPWTARGEERSLMVAGLPAHEVIYSGTNSHARVVVARGDTNDYVFIYMAPQHQFNQLTHEFNWILENFKPASKDVASISAPVQRKPATMPSTSQKATTTPVARAAPVPTSQKFAEPGFGYVMEYPGGWDFTKPAQMTAMFSGREGTPEYAAIIGVQNIQPAGATTGDESVQRALNQLRSSLGNAVRDLKVLGDKPWAYQHDGQRLVGRQISVSYIHAGQRFRKQLIAIPRPTGTVIHVWSYTAPAQQFTSFQPIARQMLASLRILTADTQ